MKKHWWNPLTWFKCNCDENCKCEKNSKESDGKNAACSSKTCATKPTSEKK